MRPFALTCALVAFPVLVAPFDFFKGFDQGHASPAEWMNPSKQARTDKAKDFQDIKTLARSMPKSLRSQIISEVHSVEAAKARKEQPPPPPPPPPPPRHRHHPQPHPHSEKRKVKARACKGEEKDILTGACISHRRGKGHRKHTEEVYTREMNALRRRRSGHRKVRFGACKRSRTFPSKGGPDCQLKCPHGTFSTSYKWIKLPLNLRRKLYRGWRALRRHGPWRRPVRWHSSVLYMCCYTKAQHVKIRAIMSKAIRSGVLNFPHDIRWSKIACRVDKPVWHGRHISFIVEANQESNSRLQYLAKRVEHLLVMNGIPLHSKRRDSEGLHVTISSITGHLAFKQHYAKLQRALKAVVGDVKKWPKFRPTKLVV